MCVKVDRTQVNAQSLERSAPSVVFAKMTFFSERQMSKHKLAKASKRVPKSMRAQRNKQDIVKSPKDNFLRSVAALSMETPLQHDPKPETTAVVPPAGALTDLSQKKDDDPKQWFVLATANGPEYSAKLIQMAQDNLQLSCDLCLSLATIKSPIEFFAVMSEFATRRIDMYRVRLRSWFVCSNARPPA